MEELVRTDNIASQVEVFDWKDAIRKAGQILIDTGDIKEAYIEDMIESVNTLGPYMVIAKGFALAHAAPCEAVLHNAVSLINLKNGVDFGSRNDPVNVVMCLACTDRQSHMEKIQKIAMRLMEEGTIERLAECKTDKELYEVFNKIKENE
ncbi:MAG: PTS sugar transporter subunit IIA [Erysipelotrichaceae bacterium]|nr:PTS sugar transporter subunit IIA [Erysipelotrichaceae bacterium]